MAQIFSEFTGVKPLAGERVFPPIFLFLPSFDDSRSENSAHPIFRNFPSLFSLPMRYKKNIKNFTRRRALRGRPRHGRRQVPLGNLVRPPDDLRQARAPVAARQPEPPRGGRPGAAGQGTRAELSFSFPRERKRERERERGQGRAENERPKKSRRPTFLFKKIEKKLFNFNSQVRAKQYYSDDHDRSKSMGVLLHGDGKRCFLVLS